MAQATKIPEFVLHTGKTLVDNGFEAYLVGGCVRDVFFLNREPEDWDLATNATPEQMMQLFPNSVYENTFGTVIVKTIQDADTVETQEMGRRLHKHNIEITTFRTESAYSDKRHPDSIQFAKTIQEDVSRRDFTFDAFAVPFVMKKNEVGLGDILDLFGGIADVKKKIIRAVGKPDERFSEDALRLVRAVRFATELGFAIEKDTGDAIIHNAHLLKEIAQERIRDEFIKIVMSENAAQGMVQLEAFGLLQFIMPELRDGIRVSQNRHHVYSVWEHSIRTLDYAARQGYSLEVRLAALLHDVSKPKTKAGDGEFATFYGHERMGSRVAERALARLHFPAKLIERVSHLVRYHMFYYNVGEVSEAGVRRFISRVGLEYLDDLIRVREADRIGSGVKKALPYKLRHLLFMIEKVRHDPVSPKMLAVNGKTVMQELGIEPGPRVGWILSELLDDALSDPLKNDKEKLIARMRELHKLADKDLQRLAQKAKKQKEEFEQGVEQEMKGKYYV